MKVIHKKCKHQFFETNKIQHGGTSDECYYPNPKFGVHVVCALCGEVRRVWKDGEIEIIKRVNTIRKGKGMLADIKCSDSVHHVTIYDSKPLKPIPRE